MMILSWEWKARGLFRSFFYSYRSDSNQHEHLEESFFFCIIYFGVQSFFTHVFLLLCGDPRFLLFFWCLLLFLCVHSLIHIYKKWNCLPFSSFFSVAPVLICLLMRNLYEVNERMFVEKAVIDFFCSLLSFFLSYSFLLDTYACYLIQSLMRNVQMFQIYIVSLKVSN